MKLRIRDVPDEMEELTTGEQTTMGDGNEYAVRFFDIMKQNRNWSAVMGTARLFNHLGRMLQDRLPREKGGKVGMTDRKLLRKIEEKKAAHGLKQG